MSGNPIWLAHLAALILIIAMFGSASRWLRFGVIASAAIGLYYAWFVLHAPMLALWQALLLAVSAIQLIRFGWREQATSFSTAEDHLRAVMLPGLPRTHARALIDRGTWVNGKAGERLLTEGEPASHLYFLHEGAAQVSFQGASVGQCAAGHLIGDATAISGEPATATVDLSTPSRLWCIWGDELRPYVTLHPEVRAVLERQLNAALRAKLSSVNQRLAAQA